ncbi:Possible exported protein [hydrothermal vent metagenome]|uniref:Possible exported protein n=1 Tax=hydrothermal vent metagenome TaxID=652676 RepID=A0A1W1E4V7_9ZZZZ
MLTKEKIIDADKATKIKEKKLFSIITGLVVAIITLVFVVLTLSINKTYRISLPPNLQFGAVVNTDEIDNFEVYSFAGAITQQLNLWKNGEVDFRKNIDKFAAYITPEYRAYLLDEYNNLLNLGQLKDRERSLQEENMYQVKNVKKQSDNAWMVKVVFHQQEHINNKRFKDLRIQHFIKVVYRNIDTESNPWGLQLDVPWKKPIRLRGF